MSGLGVTVKKLSSKVYLNYYVVCDTLDLKGVGESAATNELYERIKG